MKWLKTGTAIMALLFYAGSAKADLVFNGAVDLSGTGLGNVDTILTMQSTSTRGNGNTSESGIVKWNGTQDVVIADPTVIQGNGFGGYTSVGNTNMSGPNVQNQTLLVSATGYKSGDNLAIVFNPVEPGSTANSITLNQLVLTVYNTDGTVDFFAPLSGGPVVFPITDPGTGNSGFLFSLTQAEVGELTAAAITGDERIGLLAYATDATGGHETFFGGVIATNDQCPEPPCIIVTHGVPEPSAIAALGSGMLGIAGITWWRRRRSDDVS